MRVNKVGTIIGAVIFCVILLFVINTQVGTSTLTVQETNELKDQHPEIPPNALLQDCPGEERVEEIFSTWEPGFIAHQPDATYDERLEAWNDLMKRRGCHEFVIPYGEPIELVRRATTTDTPGYLIMECPGIEFVTDSFEEWIVGYSEQNPDATIEQKQNAWDRLLRRINCHEFTSDNFVATFQEFMDQNTNASAEYDYYRCPDEEIFERFWNSWSYDYLNNNPGVHIDTQMSDWNNLMIANDCGEEWLNPLDDLIEQYRASTTDTD